MTSIRLLLRALGAALLVSLAACGGGGGDECSTASTPDTFTGIARGIAKIEKPEGRVRVTVTAVVTAREPTTRIVFVEGFEAIGVGPAAYYLDAGEKRHVHIEWEGEAKAAVGAGTWGLENSALQDVRVTSCPT